MAEKEKCNEFLRESSSQNHPAKDQIIARLVQIREYTEKAEEALHTVQPNSQNDPKFYQLQEMLAEMRDTEKRLTDILRDYDLESPFRNSHSIENSQGFTSNYASNMSDDAGEDLSLLGAHSINGVQPGLIAERDKLRKRCQDSQLRIEALEKQKNYLLEVCGRSDGEKYSPKNTTVCNDQDLDIDNRLQIVREADSTMFSRHSQSSGGLLSSDDLFLSHENERKLPEASDKRLEIHNIISEIALLRRAKDESARKIDLLQQALNSNNVSGDALNFETPMAMGDKSDQLQELMNDAAIRSDTDLSGENRSFVGGPWVTDSFSQTITRKLTEIQTMREKLDALQSLVHTIPVPTSYQNPGTQADVSSTRVHGMDTSSRVSFIELREQAQEIFNHMNRESFRGRFDFNSNLCGISNKLGLKTQSQFPGTVPSLKDIQIQSQRSSLTAESSDDVGNLEERNLDYPRHVKSSSNAIQNNYYSDIDMRRSRNRTNKKSRSRGSSDYVDDRDRCAQRQGLDCSSSQRQESPSSSFVVYNPRELKPSSAPLWEHPSGTAGEPVLFSVPRRNARDDDYATRNLGGSVDIDRLSVAAFTSERSRELMSAEDRIVGNPVSDGVRNWGPFPNSPGVSNFQGYNNNPSILNGSGHSNGNYNNFAVEKYITESNSMLKHVVQSIGLIATGLTSQKKQLDALKDGVDRLIQRVDVWMVHRTNSTQGIHDEQMDLRRNVGHEAFSLGGKAMTGILPNIGGIEARESSGLEREHGAGAFYQAPRGHQNIHQEIPFGCAGSRAVKGTNNPMREMWSAASNAPLNVNYPSDQPNLHPFGDEPSEMPRISAFYGPNQPITPKVKRPWVSPSASMEPNRLMLNNQVPPGNRANNYWDNFRSQSRQNVLSSTSKSNESFNTVPLAINPEAAHSQAVGVSASSNFNRLDPRHDKNPGAKPIKAVMMKHFVENIGSKKRNQEQQRQSFPQRSVSVGSMHHLGGEHSGASTSESSQGNYRHGTNDVNVGAQCFGMNKLYLNNPRDLAINKLVPKDANLLPQGLQSRDCLKEMCSKVSQMRNDHIRQRTIDTLRNYVAQSVWQDQMEVHEQPDSSSFSRLNIELQQGGEPVPGTSHTQTSTPSSRSGDLNEVMWLDPDPFLSSDSRLLPYAGNGGINPLPSQSGTTRRDGGIFDDTHSYLSSSSRLPAYTRTERDRAETISSSSTGTSRPGTLNDLWMDSLRMPFVADESRLPPFIQSDRVNPIASNSSSRQGTFNDLCMESENRDPFLSSVSILPSERMRAGSESPSTCLINRFHETTKSIAEAGCNPSTTVGSSTRVGTHSSLIYSGENQATAESTQLGGGCSVPSSGPTNEVDEIKNTAATSELNVGNDLGNVGRTASSTLPGLSSSSVEAVIDSSLINIAASKFLGDTGTPESPSPVSNSGFDSSIKYKGRSMNSANNPWVSSPKSCSDGGISNVVQNDDEDKLPASKDEASVLNNSEDQTSSDSGKSRLADMNKDTAE